MKYKVSIIIPIYNVESYIARCARSLFSQSMKEVEFIFVNDCTPDNSVRELQKTIVEYPFRSKDIRILNNRKNRGPLQTRLFGLSNARGKYIGFIDADDWIDISLCEKLFDEAETKNADIVICGVSKEYACYTEPYSRKMPFESGRMLLYNTPYIGFEMFSWGCLFKNSNLLEKTISIFYNKPEWEGVKMWEDVAMMTCFYYDTDKVAYVDEPLYHYNRMNINSTLSKKDEKTVYESLKVVDFLSNRYDGDDKMALYIQYLTLGAKAPLIELKNSKIWREEHSVSNSVIMRMKSVPLKLRLSWLMMNIGIDFPYFIGRKLSHLRGRILKHN